jgi:peptidoglycan/xylan/chitin deacetylase (PgdA/CDA1 family)
MKQLVKKLATAFLCGDLVLAVYLKLRKPRPRIILYHGVSSDKNEQRSSQVIETRVFEKQANYLKKHYVNVPLSDLVAGSPFPYNGVTITFDDGYKNNLQYAAPVLSRAGFTAAVFINPAFVDLADKGVHPAMWWDILDYLINADNYQVFAAIMRENGAAIDARVGFQQTKEDIEEKLKELPADKSEAINELFRQRYKKEISRCCFPALMDWREIKELSASGFEIGAHTMRHVSVASIGPEQYNEELVRPKALIESKIGEDVLAFSFPYGNDKHFIPAVLPVLKSAGYRLALLVSAPEAAKIGGGYCLARVSIHKFDDFRMFKLKVSGLYDDLLALWRRMRGK